MKNNFLIIGVHGSFETVSKDVLLLKDQFNKMSDKLSEKIDEESNRLKESIQDLKAYLTERIDYVFSNRFNKSLGILIAAISLLFSLYLFIDAYSITQKQTAGILLLVAVIIALGTFYFYRKSNHWGFCGGLLHPLDRFKVPVISAAPGQTIGKVFS